jgi:ERCC4-related helicase
MWENDTIFICPQIDVNKELDIKDKQTRNPGKIITLETCFDDIRAKIEKLNKEGRNEKNQNAEYNCSDFKTFGDDKKTYIDYLKTDLEKINDLVERWNENDYDPKFDRFKSALKESSGLFCKERNIPHKLVIFSEAISTVKSLSRAVENITGKEPLVITAANRDEKEPIIKENFDANYDKAKQKNDYDVIITTEVLAEGINLHRANSILNYDTPWNSTRLIQRIGRVNRIGSENDNIYVTLNRRGMVVAKVEPSSITVVPRGSGREQKTLIRNFTEAVRVRFCRRIKSKYPKLNNLDFFISLFDKHVDAMALKDKPAKGFWKDYWRHFVKDFEKK